MLALCTGMRPVVMIDYGGKMPELQDRLISLLELIQEVSLSTSSSSTLVLEYVSVAEFCSCLCPFVLAIF